MVVRVPVLSEQMTEVHPSVSTLLSLRTMTFLRAMRCVPRERKRVITAGRPSGIAATPYIHIIYNANQAVHIVYIDT